MKIILTTLNSRYTHSSIGLRYLYANLKELQADSKILEFSINDAVQTIAEKLLFNQPQIIGIGVYIWNVTYVSELIHIIKKISPDTTIILGGPEVSHEPFRVNLDVADYIIQGEGENSFYELCSKIIDKQYIDSKIMKINIPSLKELTLPYEFYTDEDIKNRYIYVEVSRGCPFECEFCLSSMDEKVRAFDLDEVLGAFQKLWDRGARNFKFVDRTFNLNMKTANKILDFFLEKDKQYFAHFEVIPDHFPDSIKEKIKQFPHGALQLEIGIQTLNLEIANNISRELKLDKIKENIRFLENETKAHIHLDLIVGLPGESLESFGVNLDELVNLSSCEIQIGILKKLSGTFINRHDIKHGMVYSDVPPYDILKNTEKFDNDMNRQVKEAQKPIVFVEGDYDIRYIKKASKLFNKGELINKVTFIDADGYQNLKHIWKHNTNLFKAIPQNMLLLYDCDTKVENKQKENAEKASSMAITSEGSTCH